MATRGRPRLLDETLLAQIGADVALGLSVEVAARAAGVGPRSLRRWRAQGQRELAALSPEARLALALNEAEREARKLDDGWQAIARQLAEESPERWAGPEPSM